MKAILEDRLERLLAPGVHLKKGAGSGANGKIDVCIVQATHWLVGGDGSSDAPECVDPLIRRFCIRLNDAQRFAEYRDELKPFAARIANTKTTGAATRTRAFMAADWAVRVIAPMALDARGRKEDAATLRALPEIVDKETAETARSAARTIAAAAAYAAYAAAADDAYGAAADAYAAADAAAADAAPRPIWGSALELLSRMIAVTAPQEESV